MTARLPSSVIRAAIEMTLSPGSGHCRRCRRPWRHGRIGVVAHITTWSVGRGSFALCEPCWHDLKTPAARLPFYERAHGASDNWPQLRAAIEAGG